ncbi:MAG: hypothetical protein RIE53_09890 [Rhodothermales bacterium]
MSGAWKHSNPFDANTTVGKMNLSPDFKEFIALLTSHEVRFLVVGGYAVAFHGHPRYTKDIDLWVDFNPENARRLMDALREFGFGSTDLTEADFVAPDRVVQLGYPPNRIDLLTSLKGVEFDSCYQEKVEVVVDDVSVPFINLDRLKQNKRALGRHQDWADLENLE